MNPNKTHDILTWKKNDQYITIDKIHHETIYINKKTGKKELSLIEVDEVPPTTHKHKTKPK
jgi:hypothetical protein